VNFSATTIPGVHLIIPEIKEDVRGSFARLWCAQEFTAHGLDTRVAQSSVSTNRRRGTLRGMHYQAAPFEEVKLVRCVRGAIFDVAIDLRPESPTFQRHVAVELNASNRHALYIPTGCAHGFQTLADDTEVWYQMSQSHSAEYARGVRWNDPAFGIAWPITPPTVILERDAQYPDFAVGTAR
jgi:dTDP-4-dehydrorhamnose 3,5-epimerase